MKKTSIFFALTILATTLLTSCNLAGQAPAGLRYGSEAWIPKRSLNQAKLSDSNFLWDANGTRYVALEADADGNGTTDAYQDGLGTTKTIGMDYNLAYDMIMHPEHYQQYQSPSGDIEYKVSVTANSTFVLYDVNPKGVNASTTVATQRYAVTMKPE